MIDAALVKRIVEDYIAESEYFLVDVKVDKANRVVVEIDTAENASLDYCAELSRHIESQLDREAEDYELEVGSAGLTSPLRVVAQYHKYEGEEVEVQVKNGPKHTGILADVTDEGFSLKTVEKVKVEGAKKKVEQEKTLSFKYEEIKYTKYLISFK